MLKIGFSEAPLETKAKQESSILNRLTGFLFAAVLVIVAVQLGAQSIAAGIYVKHVFEQLMIKAKTSAFSRLTVH